MFTAIRIAKEFQVDLTLEHCTEGHLIAEELAKENFPLAVGPTLGHATKFELRNKSWDTPGVLQKAGCQVSIITGFPGDPPKIPAAVRRPGRQVPAWTPLGPLQAITINPARNIGIADRVGSLEAGKDADIVLTDGSPFEVKHQCENGVHRRGAGLRSGVNARLPLEGKLSTKETDEVLSGIRHSRLKHLIRRCAPPSPRRGRLHTRTKLRFTHTLVLFIEQH